MCGVLSITQGVPICVKYEVSQPDIICVITDPDSVQPGVRYIIEDVIRKAARQDNLETITHLDLALGRDGGKKIKVRAGS